MISRPLAHLRKTAFTPDVLRGLVWCQLALVLGVVAAQTTQHAYISHDTLIYTLVGEGIYRHGLLPYDYVFDHKPLLLYFVYGLLSFFDTGWNLFPLLSLLGLLATTAIVQALFTDRRWPFIGTLLAVTAATIGTTGFSGNSELVYIPLQFLAMGLLLHPARRPWTIWGSALASVAAFTCNYIAAVPLLPALLVCLWMRTDGVTAFIGATMGYAMAALALMAALFAAAAAAGMDVPAHLRMQLDFLTGYTGYDSGVGTGGILQRLAAFCAIALLALVPALRPARADRGRAIVLAVFLVGAVVSLVLTGNYYPHYLLPVGVAAATIVLLLRPDSHVHRLGRVAALGALSLVYAVDIATTVVGDFRADAAERHAALADTVAGQPVLAMRSSIVPFYYSHAAPYHPVVWSDHVAILHGPEVEDAVYASRIAEGPPFVLTGRWCVRGGWDWLSCALLQASYDKIDDQPYGEGFPGYTLWQRRPEAGG